MAGAGRGCLSRDVIDHQLVDTDGARVVRASDLYLARVAGVVQLVGVDVGFNSLLRRLGPARFRSVPTPEKVQFYVAAAVADRGIGPADYPGEKLDTIAGSICCNVISIFIIVATAAAIHVRAPLESAKQAAQALAPVAGRFATQLFAVGLLGASALAAAVVPLSTAYAISEAAGA